ncbi:polysaccharide biosynthesis tyrosine autokinase [Glutamicibacter sp. BW77]|uniref:polysaccharide biosynthesis tyrosine autokinase n=1 Tax=Glutamicibacter TaxID=1742989 RepID=UPI000BB85731|nr:polysaccharide biosynthesis tyrosine autokinase [Glutamicibacter sp. BW77]PCC34454.1 hypothetical protein CIK74_10575 [Glutamicibacter sp. BW77]
MELPEYLMALKRHWLLIVIVAVLGGGIGFGVGKMTPPTYSATSSVFVSASSGESTSELVQGSNFTQNLMQSYAQLATMPLVLEPVMDELNLTGSVASLRNRVSVNTPLNTVLINIRASAGSPKQAADLANAVAAELAVQAKALAPKQASGLPAIEMKPVGVAVIPKFQSAPNTKLLTATGLAGGLFVGVLYALLRSVIDTRVRSERDLTRLSEKPILGLVPKRDPRSTGISMRRTPHDLVSESYRRLAANLQFVSPDNPVTSVVVTSALPAEGKSSLAMNLAIALSENRKKVLVIDADLRRPTVATVCGIDGQYGLTTVLSGKAELSEAIVSWGPISVLPAGRMAPNPAELLSSNAMGDIIQESSVRFDYVIVDAAPLLPVSDTLALVRHVSSALLVARAGKTKAKHLRNAMESLEGVKATLCGIVLNGVKVNIKAERYSYAARIPDRKSSKIGFTKRSRDTSQNLEIDEQSPAHQ